MAKNDTYKFKAGDKVGYYKIIRVLPSEPHVRNLVLYCECLIDGVKVKRWSNRLDSIYRGCKSENKRDFKPVPHTRYDGTLVVVGENGRVVDDPDAVAMLADVKSETGDIDTGDFEYDTMNLPKEVREALRFNVDAQAMEMIKQAKELDVSTNFLFMTTLKRYLTLVHLARKLEAKIGVLDDLTIVGSNGSQVANPLITQYKQVSSESNVTVRILNNIVSKMGDNGAGDDPLLNALSGNV